MSAAPAPPALARLLERPRLQKIFEALDGDGEELRVVGGAARDALLGREPAEIDLATTAPPPVVLERARRAGLRAIPTGIEHGTVTLRAEGESFEVTSLREDVETDGRRAKVRFGRDFRADALRRDFTLNALSLSRDGLLHDYVGGLDDLLARKVRFIGEPATRIREDYLRVLRFFRFSAGYAEAIDAAGFWACVREREGLARLSRERVRAELFKTLIAPRAAWTFEAMNEAGLLGRLVGGAPDPARLGRLIEAFPDADALLRLAALRLLTEEDADDLAARLKLSNAERGRLEGAARALVAIHGARRRDEALLRRLLYLYGRPAALDGARLAFCDAQALAFVASEAPPRSPLSAAQLIARGLSGKALGAALRRFETLWVASGFSDDAGAVAAMIDEAASGAS